MNSIFKISFLFLFVSSILSAFSLTEVQKTLDSLREKYDFPVLTVDNELKSKRISKGKVLNPDPVHTFNTNLSWHGAYFDIFYVQDLTDYNKKRGIQRFEFEKFEYTIGYKFVIPELLLGKDIVPNIGYRYISWNKKMTNKDDDETKHKLIAEVYVDCLLQPGVNVDFDPQYDYMYFDFFIRHSFKIEEIEKLSFDNRLNVYLMNSKYNKHEYDVNKTAFTTVYYRCYLRYQYSKYSAFGPLFEASWALDSDIRDSMKKDNRNNSFNFLIGIKTDFTF